MVDRGPRRNVFGGFVVCGQRWRGARALSGSGDTLRVSPHRAPESDRGSLWPRSGRVSGLSSCPVGRESPRLVDRIGWNRWTLTRWLPVPVDRYPGYRRHSPSLSIGPRACLAEGVSRAVSGGREGSRRPRMENHGERRRVVARLRRSEQAAPFDLRSVPPIGEVRA